MEIKFKQIARVMAGNPKVIKKGNELKNFRRYIINNVKPSGIMLKM